MVTVCVRPLARAPVRGGNQVAAPQGAREDVRGRRPLAGCRRGTALHAPGAALVLPGGAGGPHTGMVRGAGSHPRSWGLTLTLAHRAVGVQWTLCWRNPFPGSLLEVPRRPERPWVGRV